MAASYPSTHPHILPLVKLPAHSDSLCLKLVFCQASQISDQVPINEEHPSKHCGLVSCLCARIQNLAPSDLLVAN